MTYQWTPRTYPSEDAIARMRSRFPRPAEPMGESWFMGKQREMYTRLMTQPIAEARVEYLTHALGEISSGTHSFGHQQEWDSWFRYLLPDLIARGHEEYAFGRLFEHTTTAFMQVYWQGADREYSPFLRDALESVPISLMHPDLWSPNTETPSQPATSMPSFLLKEHNGRLFIESWGMKRARPDLSAAMFFCLKYLSPFDMRSWVDSLLAIQNPHWKAALLVWLSGAQPVLTSEAPVPQSLMDALPGIGWEHSHALGSPVSLDRGDYSTLEGHNPNACFLDPESTRTFWEEIRRPLAGGLLREWEADLWAEPRLAQVAGLAEMLDGLCLSVAA